MNKMLSLTLRKSVDEIVLTMSNKTEKKEKIKVEEIIPLSDITAAVVLEWESKRRVLFYFYFVDVQGGKWWHFIPKDGHLNHVDKLFDIRQLVLQHNFKHNCNAD